MKKYTHKVFYSYSKVDEFLQENQNINVVSIVYNGNTTNGSSFVIFYSYEEE